MNTKWKISYCIPLYTVYATREFKERAVLPKQIWFGSLIPGISTDIKH